VTCCGILFQTRAAATGKAEFVDEVRQCQPTQAFVYEDGEFEVNPFTNLQPMELTKNRSDVVEFRRRKNQLSRCIRHRLEPLKEDVLRCRPGSSCRSPVETKQVTTRATGERASILTDGCSVVDAAPQNRPTRSL